MAVPILTVSDIQEIERKLQAKKKPPPLPPRQRALSNLRRSDPVELMVHRNTVAEEGYRSSPETPDPGMRASANTPLIETEYPPIPQSEEEKRAARRIQVAKELVSTEKTYCKSLQQIVSDYLHPLKLDPSLQKKKKLDIIFMNTEEIMLLHLPMLHDLEQCVTNNNSNNIGEIFLKTASYNFSLYKTFCAQYAEALSCLAECIQNSSKFAAFIQAQDGQLESLLIQPVQRIPRYRLLFGELLKYTPEDHPDYQPTVKALKCIEEIAIHVNESVREKENQDKLLQIQQSFTNKAPTIVNPHRKFIREGILVKMCRRTPKRRYFFLFSDLLIYGSTNELAANMNRVTYTFHRSSDLSQVIVEDIPVEDGGTDNAFHIRSNQKSFVVFAEDYEAKKAWMNDFNVAKNYGKTGTNDGDAEIAPIWVPDKLVKNCMQCNVKFTTINRRHHCRKCGDLVCSACSSKKFTLPNIGKLCRVCEICFRVLNDGTVDPRSVEKKPLASKEKFNLAQTATKKFAGIEGRGTAVNINVAYSSLLDKDEPTNTVPSDTVSSAPTTPAPTPPLSPSLQTKKPMSDSVAYLATLKTNSNRRARNISPRGGSPLAGDSDYLKECPIAVPPPPPPRKNSI